MGKVKSCCGHLMVAINPEHEKDGAIPLGPICTKVVHNVDRWVLTCWIDMALAYQVDKAYAP